jgi:tRNA A-37 threonylcarbamoyl transferase component Bud32/tetratricopeptide (TPR) repeat protein
MSPNDATQDWHPPEHSQPAEHQASITRDGGETHTSGTGTRPVLSRPEVPGYEILDELGRGGMGVVFKARQQKLNRVVALKMILSGTDADDQDRTRFRTEAEAIARLQHPHIVQVFEVGEHAGKSYLSLEFCEGGSLEKKLRAGGLPAGQAAHLVETLARAVQAAHERQVIHRDLKPANILLTAEGAPKVTDFGLAKKLDQQAGQTHSGTLLGTPSYMAPEQARGLNKELGPAVDIYALGAILYECLTGQPPFREDSLWDTVTQVIEQEPIPPRRLRPKVPRDLETICLKCLSKEPARRYATALALAEDLHAFQTGEPIRARRVGRTERVWRWCRRNRGVAVLSAVVLVCVLAGVGVAAYLIAERDRSAAQFTTARQVQDLWDQLEQRLALPPEKWSPEHVAAIKAGLQELTQLDPVKGQAGTKKLYEEAVPALAQKLMAEGKLQPEQQQQILFLIQLVAEQEKGLADTLHKDLAFRLTQFNEVFALTTPFGNLDQVFRTQKQSLTKTDKYLNSVPVANPVPIILSDVPSPGVVGLKAKFAALSNAGTEMGLLLNATDAKKLTGYAFLLKTKDTITPPGAAKARPATLAEARAQQLSIFQQIWREGVLLHQRQVAPADLPAGKPVVLHARREGDHLTFQINKAAPLEFYEVFPVTGKGNYGLVWPAETPLEELQALHQPLPTKPSPLEKGDAYFSQADFDNAIHEYRQQAKQFQQPDLQQEAKVKEALALIESKQPGAVPLLAKVASEPGKRWPFVAACQLWLLHVRQKEYASAQLALNQVLMHKQVAHFGQLSSMIPLQVRDEILGSYDNAGLGGYVLATQAEREEYIQKHRLLVDLEELFEVMTTVRFAKYLELVRAYRFNNQSHEALQAMKKWIQQEGGYLIEELVWILLEQGMPQEALAEIDQHLAQDKAAGHPHARPALLIERARALIALGKKAVAEKELETYFALVVPQTGPPGQIPPWPENVTYRYYSDACLVLGFLHLERGDTVGAKQIWAQGMYRKKFEGGRQGLGGVLGLYNAVFAGILSEKMTDQELDPYIDWALERASVPAFFIPSLKKGLPLHKIFRAAVTEPKGYDYARQLAYHQLSWRQTVLVPAELVTVSFIRDQAFASKFGSAPEEALVRQFATAGIGQFLDKKITAGTILNLGMFWAKPQDLKAPVVLGALRTGLPPTLFPSSAYLFGRRYLQMNNKDQARAFFEAVHKDAPPGSEVARLAQLELTRLGAKGQ